MIILINLCLIDTRQSAIITTSKTKNNKAKGIRMSQSELMKYTVKYRDMDEKGNFFATTEVIENVVREFYEGCFFCVVEDGKEKKTHKFPSDLCIKVEHEITYREAINAPEI